MQRDDASIGDLRAAVEVRAAFEVTVEIDVIAVNAAVCIIIVTGAAPPLEVPRCLLPRV